MPVIVPKLHREVTHRRVLDVVLERLIKRPVLCKIPYVVPVMTEGALDRVSHQVEDPRVGVELAIRSATPGARGR